MRKIRTAAAALVCTGMLAGCTGGGVFGTNNTTVGNPVFNPTNAVLQLSVGTANDAFGAWHYLLTSGGSTSTSGAYLNAVATFRAPNGLSAFPVPGSSNATLTSPTSATSTIGSVFAYGQFAGTNGVTGLPPTYPSAGAPGAGFPTGFLTTSGGSRIFSHPTGTYTLSTTVTQNGVPTPYSATATLASSANVLGAWASAPVWTANLSHDGGGTFTLPAAPAGVTETLVLVYQHPASCGFSRFASVETTTVTPTTVTLPPGTLPLVCSDFTTTATYGAVAIGADYPMVESGPPTNTQQSPALGGSHFDSNSDLTFSGRTPQFFP